MLRKSLFESCTRAWSSFILSPFPATTAILVVVSAAVMISPTLAAAVSSPTPPCCAVAYWSLDDNLKDTSGNGNDGMAKGDAHFVSGYEGNALSLDGDGDYVTVKDSSTLRLAGAFTLAAWVKLDTLTPEGHHLRILEKGTSPGEKYWMFYVKSSKKIGFGFINSEKDVQVLTQKTNWQSGRWYHVVATYDPAVTSNNMKIYVDGVLDNMATKTGKPNINYKPLVIGTRSTANWEFWPGDIDELRIYKRALTANEVTNLYESAHKVTYTFCSSGCNYNNLQTAINALPVGGGTIVIKDGTYTMSNTIYLKSHTTLEFSPNAHIQFTGTSKPILRGNNIDDVVIRGGYLTAGFTGVKAIAFWDSSGITVDGTKITLVRGSDSNAFYCVDCTDVHISNINAKTASRLIDIKTDSRINDGLSRNIWVLDSVIDDVSAEGIRVAWSTDVHITGNTVTNTQNNGIDIGWSKNSEVKWNTLKNVGLPVGSGIHTDSAIGALVANNYIDGTGEAGITVFRASNIDVIGNTIKNAGASGVDIITTPSPSSFITVKSNHIIAPTNNGIYVSPSQYVIKITYNTIEQLSAGKKGIYVNSPNPTTTVSGNTVR